MPRVKQKKIPAWKADRDHHIGKLEQLVDDLGRAMGGDPYFGSNRLFDAWRTIDGLREQLKEQEDYNKDLAEANYALRIQLNPAPKAQPDVPDPSLSAARALEAAEDAAKGIK